MGSPCGRTLFCPSRGCPTHYNPDGTRKINPYPWRAKPQPAALTKPTAQTQPTAKPQPPAKPRPDQPTRGKGGGIRAPRLNRTSQAGKTPAPTISWVEKPVKEISKKELLATAERFANKINELLAFTGTSVAENGEITIKIRTNPPTTPPTPSTTASPVAPPPSFSIIQSVETSATPPSSSPAGHRSTSISTTSRRQRRTSGPGVAIPKDGIKKIARKSTTKTYRNKEVEKYFLD